MSIAVGYISCGRSTAQPPPAAARRVHACMRACVGGCSLRCAEGGGFHLALWGEQMW